MIKLYAALALAALLVIGIGYYGCKKQWQAEQELKAHKEVQKQTQEVQREQEKRKEEVEKMSPRQLLDWFHGVRP